jgi:hypothetical protein
MFWNIWKNCSWVALAAILAVMSYRGSRIQSGPINCLSDGKLKAIQTMFCKVMLLHVQVSGVLVPGPPRELTVDPAPGGDCLIETTSKAGP